MGVAEEDKLDPAVVEGWYHQHAEQLRRFLVGLLRDAPLAGDVLQATFVKAVEMGHTARPEARKAWLFRVAYNEAMALRRRQAIGRRVVQQAGWSRSAISAGADDPLVRLETVELVRAALQGLPAAQRQVVQMRIYQEKTFATIAEELQIPLGTALARMRAALKKLRKTLQSHDPD